jgi:hypothetical protein
MAIFHSYVKLPEGTDIFQDGTNEDSMWKKGGYIVYKSLLFEKKAIVKSCLEILGEEPQI